MRRLTLKQQTFVREYLANGGNGTQAVLEAYPNAGPAARIMASENLTKPNIKSEIQQALESEDLQAFHAVRTLKRGLDCKDGSGHPDNGNQLKAVDLTLKLLDAYPRDSSTAGTVHNTQINVYSSKDPRLLEYYVRSGGRWPSKDEESKLLAGESE